MWHSSPLRESNPFVTSCCTGFPVHVFHDTVQPSVPFPRMGEAVGEPCARTHAGEDDYRTHRGLRARDLWS